MNEKKMSICLFYEGSQYDSGKMDIKDFAPSLLAFGEIIEEFNKILNNNSIAIKTLINADFERKCFKCELEIHASLLNKIESTFGFVKNFSVDDIIRIVGFIEDSPTLSSAAGGLIASYIAWLIVSRGKKIKSEKVLQNGNTEVVFEEIETKQESSHQVEVNLWGIIKYIKRDKKSNKKIHNALKSHLKPDGEMKYKTSSNNEGSITSTQKKDIIQNIENDNILNDDIKNLPTTESEEILMLLTPTAKDDCMWEFDDCGNKKYYTMKDMDFFTKYKTNQIKLGGNEKMKLKIRTENLYVNGVMKKEYTILEMIEILPERDLFTQ